MTTPIPKPSAHELLVNSDGGLNLARTGELVTALECTGVLRSGQRFSAMRFEPTISGWKHLMGINLYSGTKWARLASGARIKLSSTTN